ncbi:MAG: hypothetical protein DRI94_12470 [Bacteroidetes bacterium]|nr:MAG: hypothetical protein DRI94_12470 [Bacteroidota bacterium]
MRNILLILFLSASILAYSKNVKIDDLKDYEGKPFTGVAYSYFPDGKIFMEQHYKNGNKESEGTYEDCHEVGYWIYYFENGTLKAEKKY